MRLFFTITTYLTISISIILLLQSHANSQVTWKQVFNQNDQWYSSDEAIRIADQVLLYQLDIGGWSKNIDMARPLSEEEKKELIQQKPDQSGATIDNSATYTQLRFLAKIYEQSKEERFKTSFEKGLEFLLDMQYGNGGFPQFPFQGGYKVHITYNDNAMIGVLQLLQDIASHKTPYTFVNEPLRNRSNQALQKAIDCILKTQVEVDGKKTVWCAQHDKDTLKPAPARSYEKISLSGSESAGIVRFLMGIENPSDEIKASIESAINWFNDAKIMGLKEIRKQDSSLPRGFDKIMVKDADASPLWARFYEIGTNTPIFCGRDGIIKYSLAEIEHERRVGYSWYTNSPERLLNNDYPKWKASVN